MDFSLYLRECRNHLGLTQEELAQELYTFDGKEFSGIQMTTISKWERGITLPRINKQIGLLKYFQSRTGLAFPCIESLSSNYDSILCDKAVEELIIGEKHKTLVFDFASDLTEKNKVKISHLKYVKNSSALLEMVSDIKNESGIEFVMVDKDKINEWILYPGNIFLHSDYKEVFMGLLFSIKLKQETFKKIIAFEKNISELKRNDFASTNDFGSHLIFAFTSMNENVASALFVKYYSHLIANQRNIGEVGSIALTKESRRILYNMNLKLFKTLTVRGKKISSYSEKLNGVFASKNFLKITFLESYCGKK